MEYVLNLNGNLSAKLQKIGIQNEKQLDTWAKVQTQVNAANKTMNQMGRSMGSLKERIAALQAQREWIPASNREAIRASNLEIKKLNREVQKLESLNGGRFKKWTADLKASVPALNMLTNPLAIAAAGMYKLGQYVSNSKQAYQEESVQVAKLQQIMSNTMGVRGNEMQSVLNLAAAQQKLGVIGDETQLAGAQELATYLGKKESLEKLMPAMNDMLAQQYGLNATQEQASTIGMMMGKVMQGQTEALSRYGYKFTEAQKKILKTGTEAERAATLFDVVSEAVGGTNEALAKTPEGKLKQQANNMGDLQERVGKLVITAQSAFSPLIGVIGEAMDKIISFFESHEAQFKMIFDTIVKIGTIAFKALCSVITVVKNVIGGFFEGLKNHSPVCVLLAGVITGITVAMIAFKTWTALVTIGTSLWAAAQQFLNIILTLNPIGLIIAAIVALIAIIAYVAMTTTGWGQTWRNIMAFMKLGIELFKTSVQRDWLIIKDAFLSGFEIIEKGWYKLKSLWDKDGTKAALDNLEAERNKRATEIAQTKGKIDEITQTMKTMTIFEIEGNGKGWKDVLGGAKEKFGIGTNDSLQAAANGAGGGGADNTGGGVGNKTTESVATGGTRNTNIKIDFKNLIENIVFQGGTSENRQEIERNLAEAMFRVLNMAQSSVS